MALENKRHHKGKQMSFLKNGFYWVCKVRISSFVHVLRGRMTFALDYIYMYNYHMI